MSVDLKHLISEVRSKDLRHRTINYDCNYSKENEEQAWKDRVQARKNLRDAIYGISGVNIHELEELTRT